MGGCDLLGPLSFAHHGPLEGFGFARSPGNDAELQQSISNRLAVDAEILGAPILGQFLGTVQSSELFQIQGNFASDAERMKSAMHGLAGTTEVLRAFQNAPTFIDVQFLERFKVDVNSFHDEIISIRPFDYDGPVYDVETDTGVFLLSSDKTAMTMQKNCRCWTSVVLAPPARITSNPESMKLFSDHAAKAIPDPHVYGQWFAQAPEYIRRKAVGSARYSAAKHVMGRDPDWAHFWSPAKNRLLTAKEIVREEPRKMAKRLEKVRKQEMRQRADLAKVATYGFLVP